MLKILLLSGLLTVSLLAKDALTSYDFETLNLSSWHSFGTWKINQEKDNKVLSMTKRSKGGFNLCYTKEVDFLDGSASVKFRANTGRIDQGGGLMWRVQYDENYYVARFNPLEDNFRFYIVQDGIRREIASANVTLKKGWHTMRIAQKDDAFTGYIDGKKHLEHRDNRLQKSGGVGVWTKADAGSSFDDLSIMISK